MEAQPDTGNQLLRAEAGEDAAADAQAAKPREAYWDNVKAVCVLFVVFCHCFVLGSTVAMNSNQSAAGNGQQADPADPPNFDNATAGIELFGSVQGMACFDSVFMALSVVVMPGFSFVSGHLSSREISTPHRVRALLKLGLTAAIQQVMIALLTSATSASLPIRMYGSVGVQWYIICMLFWRLTLPFWMMLRAPMTTSVIVGTLTLLVDADNFLFRSYLGFLPFFIAGHLTCRETLRKYRRPASRIGFFLAVALAAAVPPLLLLGETGADIGEGAKTGLLVLKSVYFCFNFHSEVCDRWFAIPARLLYYLAAVVMIPTFLALIPERRVWGLTRAGVFSMYIYLLHIWLLPPWFAVVMALHLQTGPLFGGSIFYTFAVWALLGTGCARPVCKCCIEPRLDCLVQAWVLKDTAEEQQLAPEGQPEAAAQV